MILSIKPDKEQSQVQTELGFSYIQYRVANKMQNNRIDYFK